MAMLKDEIIKKLAEMDPAYDNDAGDTPCFFCGCVYDDHEDDCIWKAAKDLCEEPEVTGKSYGDWLEEQNAEQ
jgi:hypothetical protein